jgi:hypothetical protein
VYSTTNFYSYVIVPYAEGQKPGTGILKELEAMLSAFESIKTFFFLTVI